MTIRFLTFQDYKDFILSTGQGNPNRTVAYRFHSLSANKTVNKITEIYAGGSIVLLYDSPTGETISSDDPWLSSNADMQYPKSTLVADIGESIA